MRIRYKLDKVKVTSLGRTMSRFGGHLRHHRLRLSLSALSLLGVSLFTLLQPWPLKIVFDYVLMPGGAPKVSLFAPIASWNATTILILAASAILGFAILKGLLTYGHSVLSKVVGHRLVADIRMQLFAHVQRLPQSYHDYRETGDLMTRMTGDISLLKDLLVSTIITLTSQLLLIAGMLAVLFWIDWTLALVTFSVMPFFALAAFRFSPRIKYSARRQRDAYGKIVASVQESFAGISQVKGFAQERNREKLIGKSMEHDVKANVKTTKLSANYARTVELISAIGTSAVLLLGAKKALAGTISPGDLLVFLAYLKGMYRPLQGVARLTTRISKAAVRGEKIIEILDMPTEVHDAHGAVSARDIAGDIRFERVSFSYVDGQPTLRDLSCHIPAGKTTIIVGPTGAGKSTIAKLILRLYDPQQGAITVDGHDISRFRVRSLRKKITPLTQDTFLFRMSIGENIAFGKRKATQNEIEEAARLVGADQFIEALPNGYDTLVGEGGLTLSGGQRQRISLARAAIRQSPVMMFDEPATGLDVHAENEAKEVLRSLRENRTLLIITHRLHFMDMADWVVFVSNGTVVQEGPPSELLSKESELGKFLAHDARLGTEIPIDGMFGMGGEKR